MEFFKKLLVIIVLIFLSFQFALANDLNLKNKDIEMTLIEKGEMVEMKGPMTLPPSKEEVEFLVKRHEENEKGFFSKIWSKIVGFFVGLFS